MTRALILATMLLTSCSGQWLARMYEKEALIHLENGIYVKNMKNGMCFIITNSYRNVDAIWVPCDSLKGERVLLYYPQKMKP